MAKHRTKDEESEEEGRLIDSAITVPEAIADFDEAAQEVIQDWQDIGRVTAAAIAKLQAARRKARGLS